MTSAEAREELRLVRAELDRLYWAFTRTARGKPPVLVRPDLYQRAAELERVIADARREAQA